MGELGDTGADGAWVSARTGRDRFPLLIAAVTLAAYAGSVRGVFLFDDLPRLLQDARVAHFPECVLQSSLH